MPDYVPVLRDAERWGSPPWEVWDDPESPSKAWWRHQSHVLARADAIAHERQMSEAKSKVKK